MRSPAAPTSALEAATAFPRRLGPGRVFAGATAARLWGLPVDGEWSDAEPLVVGVPAGLARSRANGVRSLRFDKALLPPGDLDGVPTLGPIGAVTTMARSASLEQLTTLVDALITTSSRYPGLGFDRPHTTIAELQALVQRCRRMPGAAALAAAVAAARAGVDSPRETLCRLTIVAAGLPEPVVQHPVVHDGRVVAELDLAYPQLRIAIEYEGDHHRTDARQWTKDIRRQELLESMGWIVIRVTSADLRDGGRPLVARVRSALARRGA